MKSLMEVRVKMREVKVATPINLALLSSFSIQVFVGFLLFLFYSLHSARIKRMVEVVTDRIG